MNSIKLSAPAKVNLFLKVLSKRKDGYHNILTLFSRVSLSDKITLSRIPHGIKLTSNKFITAKPKDNLAYKAAEAIFKYVGGTGYRVQGTGVRIRVEKRIPIAAGLGGGSSDAAVVLTGMNRLFNLKISRKALMRLGAKLGADVPFFVMDTPFAIGRARGDDLKKVNLKIRPWQVIIYPGFKLSTRSVYEALRPSHFGLTTDYADVKISALTKPAMDFDTLEAMLSNDLEETAIVKKRVLGRIIERLAYSSGKNVIVSGSGPSVFCLCGTREEAVETRRRLLSNVPARERKGWQAFVTRTM